MKKELGILTLLLVLCGVTAFLNPRFLSGTNLTNMANIIGLYGVFSLGLGLVIITGGIDLSVGSMFALAGVLLSVIMWFVLHRSVYGRYLLAVGRNEEAARFSGINTRFVIATAYVLMGLLTGIAGILLAFYTNSISPSNHGNFYELYGIAAAVLGGCSLRGGDGSILGIVIGTALLQVLQNLVNLLGIPSSLNFAVMGAVVLIGVVADQILKRRSAQS